MRDTVQRLSHSNLASHVLFPGLSDSSFQLPPRWNSFARRNREIAGSFIPGRISHARGEYLDEFGVGQRFEEDAGEQLGSPVAVKLGVGGQRIKYPLVPYPEVTPPGRGSETGLRAWSSPPPQLP